MKHSQLIGIAASLVLVAACFLPWTFHPDLNREFTGFFSENNVYGRPGRVFVVFSAFAIIFYIIPRIWAKRWNLLVTGLTTAFAIRCFIMFTGCYRGICPERKPGIWLMLMATLVMLVMAILPDIKLKDSNSKELNRE